MAKLQSLIRAQAIMKMFVFLFSTISLGLYYEYGAVLYSKNLFAYIYEGRVCFFTASVTPIVPLYFLIMYVCGDVEPEEHPVSTAVFDFPFVSFNFTSAFFIFIPFDELIIEETHQVEAGIMFSGIFFLIVGILLFVDGVFAIIKSE